MPTTGQRLHWPANQCWTAVYQSSVVGRKMRPSRGQRTEEKIPSNQRVNNHRTATRSRGVNSARSAKRQGIRAWGPGARQDSARNHAERGVWPSGTAAAQPALGCQLGLSRAAIERVGKELAVKAAALGLGIYLAEREAGLPALRARGANADDPAQPGPPGMKVYRKYRCLTPPRSSGPIRSGGTGIDPCGKVYI